MDRRLFAKRLQQQRKACGYSSREDFAEAYNKRFGQYNPDNPYGGVLGTIKNYENPNHSGTPKLDIVDNMCSMLDCDIDFLLGYIDLPHHEQQVVHDKVGLSETAVLRLLAQSPPENAFINFLLCSDSFFELDFIFSNLVSHIKWFNSCINSVHQCEQLANGLDKNSSEYKELDRSWNTYMDSAKRWAAELEVNIYQMGIIFGNMLNQYKKERVIVYGSHRED